MYYKDVIKNVLKNEYGIAEVINCEDRPGGSADCKVVRTKRNQYFVKIFPANYERNRVAFECQLRAFVAERGLPVAQVINTVHNLPLVVVNDRIIQVQEYVDGLSYLDHNFPTDLMIPLAQLLAQCTLVLQTGIALPFNIASQWFNAKRGQEKIAQINQLRHLLTNKHCLSQQTIEADLRFKQEILEIVSDYTFDLAKFSSGGSHGDFNCRQVLVKDGKIISLVDFANAGVVPYGWEIIRSFTSSDKSCKQAELDINRLRNYVTAFHRLQPLCEYDLQNMVKLYLYQLARSHYGYWQGMHKQGNYNQLLRHGHWRTLLTQHIYQNLNKISDALMSIAA